MRHSPLCPLHLWIAHLYIHPLNGVKSKRLISNSVYPFLRWQLPRLFPMFCRDDHRWIEPSWNLSITQTGSNRCFWLTVKVSSHISVIPRSRLASIFVNILPKADQIGKRKIILFYISTSKRLQNASKDLNEDET